MFIEYCVENNDKDPSLKTLNQRFKVGDHVRISKYKNIFAKGFIPYLSEEVFVIKKSKKHCRGHILLAGLDRKVCNCTCMRLRMAY